MQTRLQIPVLALGGEVFCDQFMGQEWTKYASNVQGEAVSPAGHWISEEQPTFRADWLMRVFVEG